jgi:hypothetical protein
MTEAEFDAAMDKGELEDEYYEYVFNKVDFPSEEYVFQCLENNNFLEDFKDSKVKEYA